MNYLNILDKLYQCNIEYTHHQPFFLKTVDKTEQLTEPT